MQDSSCTSSRWVGVAQRAAQATRQVHWHKSRQNYATHTPHGRAISVTFAIHALTAVRRFQTRLQVDREQLLFVGATAELTSPHCPPLVSDLELSNEQPNNGTHARAEGASDENAEAGRAAWIQHAHAAQQQR